MASDSKLTSLFSGVIGARVAQGTAAFDAVLAFPGHENLRAFYAYWQSKQTNGRPPQRAEIDPAEIPRLLPNVQLIEVISNPEYDFRYRLVGTEIVRVDGSDYRGMRLSEIIPPDDFQYVREHYLSAAAGAVEVRLGNVKLRYDGRRWHRDGTLDHVHYLTLLLPLRRDGDAIEILFGYVHYVVT